MTKQVAIIGGGLGGLSCAKKLAEAGFKATVFESLPYLGGRASTYKDSDGDWIEQGVHIFLGTYSEFKKLLNDIGKPSDEILFWMEKIRFQDTQGSSAVYNINPLRSPLASLLTVLGQNNYLGPVDKITALPIIIQGLLRLRELQEKYDNKTVAQLWAKAYGTQDVMERFLRPFCRAIQFTDVEDFSAFNFLGWIHNSAYDLLHALAGGYQDARNNSIFEPLALYLKKKGVSIRTQLALEKINYSPSENKIASIQLNNGKSVHADAYVIAIPAWKFSTLMPEEFKHQPFFAKITTLPTAPAIAVQIWLDRSVIENNIFNLVAHSPMPVYQEQAKTYGYTKGDKISVTISPADEYLSLSDNEIINLTHQELGKINPQIKAAKTIKSVVLKHQQHLIRPLPGAMTQRPPQKTPIPNLFLAGDWTQQDYFGSQEGAVRGGIACAKEIIKTFIHY